MKVQHDSKGKPIPAPVVNYNRGLVESLITARGLIRGVTFSKASTTRAHAIMVNHTYGTKRTLKTISLRERDFKAAYNEACKAIADLVGLNEHGQKALFDLTKTAFVAHYGLTFRTAEICETK